jgi:cytochrome b561
MHPPRYAPSIILLHWLTALLIVAAYATIELREIFPRDSDPRELMKSWHFMIGLTIFALVWLRLLLRLILPTPAAPTATPKWQRLASGAVHAALYAFLLAMPATGWLQLSLAGDPILWLGIELPPLARPDESLAELFEEIHETIGKAAYFLIAIHTAAALWHHYLIKDGALVRMLPARLRSE